MATALLYAEARLGELLKSCSKGTFKKGGEKALPSGITKKQSHFAQQLYENKDLIEEVIAEAKDNEDIPTRTEVLRKAVKLKHTSLPTPTLPKGKYRVIYADPPWQFSNTGFEESAEQQYPTMTTEEICKLPVVELTHNQSVLFLWATNAMLEDALRVIKTWGFSYKSNFVWIKNKGPSIGWFTISRHELLLIATKDDNLHPAKKFNSWFEAEVTKHSQKPNKVYEMIEQMYSSPYIELFARNTRKNWSSWGNELVKSRETGNI
jgi:site-specific DNA-methyltransferase (adenine-specific)